MADKPAVDPNHEAGNKRCRLTQDLQFKSASLQSGVDFRGVKISYKTYGQLAADKANVVVPSSYTLTYDEVETLSVSVTLG